MIDRNKLTNLINKIYNNKCFVSGKDLNSFTVGYDYYNYFKYFIKRIKYVPLSGIYISLEESKTGSLNSFFIENEKNLFALRQVYSLHKNKNYISFDNLIEYNINCNIVSSRLNICINDYSYNETNLTFNVGLLNKKKFDSIFNNLIFI